METIRSTEFSRPKPRRATASPGARAAFAFCAALVAMAALIALDRVGAPQRLIAALAPTLALIGLAAIGGAARTTQPAPFFTAARALPPGFGALAGAAGWLALAAPFAPPHSPGPAPRDLALGFAAAGCAAALVFGPMLRRSGAYSFAGLIGTRFPSPMIRAFATLAAAATAALTLLAGMEGAAEVAAPWLGVTRAGAAACVGATLFALCAPGGLRGGLWAACGAFGLAALALSGALAARLGAGAALPLPVLGDRAAMMAGLSRLAGFEPPAWAPSWTLVALLGVGLALLAPAAGMAIGQPDAAAARRAAGGALGWAGALAAMALAAMILSVDGLDMATIGAAPEALPESIYAAAERGEIRLCGAFPASPAAARAACAATPGFPGALRLGDATPAGPNMLALALATPQAAAIAAAMIALGLTLAAAGLQALTGALAEAGLRRARRVTASRRLALARLAMIAALSAGGWLVAAQAWPAGLLLLAAAAICATIIAPLLALALWPLAGPRDAWAGLAAGAAAGLWFGGASGEPWRQAESPLGLIAAIGGAILIAGLASSLTRGIRRRDPSFENWRESAPLARDSWDGAL